MAELAGQKPCGDFAIVGKTRDDGFGCLIIAKQSAATPETMRETLDQLSTVRDAPGFVVDLRGGCTGGDERLACEVAQFFCGERVVYARSKYRDGPAHDAFGAANERALDPHAQPFTRPVVCLIGQKCMSSGEADEQAMRRRPPAVARSVKTPGESTGETSVGSSRSSAALGASRCRGQAAQAVAAGITAALGGSFRLVTIVESLPCAKEKARGNIDDAGDERT